MIQQQTILKISDNSGAKTARCIKPLGGFKKKYAKIGDIVVVSIQTLRNRGKQNAKVKKGEVHKALIIRTKIAYKNYKKGLTNTFNENSIILLNKNKTPLSTRIVGPLPAILKKKKFQKIISLSSRLI